MAHGALGGVFHGDDAQEVPIPFRPVEDMVDGGGGPQFRAVAEMGPGGQVAEGAFRAEIGYGQRRLEGPGGGKYLPEDLRDRLVWQWPRIVPFQEGQDPGLLVGTVNVGAGFFLDLADGDGPRRPFVQKAQQFRVDVPHLPTKCFQ